MNCEYFKLDPQTLEYITNMDLSKIHKLFLSVDIINNSYYMIAKNMTEKLNKLDLSKIIILSYSLSITANDLAHCFIATKEWPVQIIPFHSNFVLGNYNFIYTNKSDKITKHYLANKITVLLCSNSSESFDSVPILIHARSSNYKRILTEPGIQVTWDYPDETPPMYFRLEGETVTLHPI